MKRDNQTATWILSVILSAAASPVLAQDWPQWRGPARDGKAVLKAPATWPKALTQKWKVAVGDGVSTPALVGDKLYVFSRQQNSEVIRCLDAATGKEIWQDKYDAQGATGPAASFSGPRSSPAVADGKVVTIGVRGMVSCLDAASGKVLWRKDDFQGATPNFFTSSSPIIVDGLAIAQLGGRNNAGIVAYDLASGEQKWKWAGDNPAYSSPALMTVDGVKLIIAMTERRIVGLSAADGKLLWEAPFAAEGRAYNAATPVIDGQTLIYSGGGRGTTAVKLQKQGDAITAQPLWRNADQAVQFNTPVVKDGMVYALSQSNDLVCLNMTTGQVAWTAPAAAAAAGGAGAGAAPAGGGGRGRGGRGGGGGGGYGSIIDAGSVLLALTPASELIVFQPGEKYTEQARIKIADTPTHAYPIVSGGRIVIKDQDSLALLSVE